MVIIKTGKLLDPEQEHLYNMWVKANHQDL